MPTRRIDTTSLCTGTTLIVAGGMGVGDRSGVLSTVEVMNTENHQWSTAADLPEPMFKASATICGDQLYMLGGIDKTSYYSKSVYTCSVSELLELCVSNQPQLATSKRTYKAGVWSQIADVPFVRSRDLCVLSWPTTGDWWVWV